MDQDLFVHTHQVRSGLCPTQQGKLISLQSMVGEGKEVSIVLLLNMPDSDLQSQLPMRVYPKVSGLSG